MDQNKPKTIWTTTKKKVSDLKFHPKNPRIYTDKDIDILRRDIEEFGYADPVIINLDNVLIAGHRRCSLFIADGKSDEEIDVRTPSRLFSAKEHERLMLKLNKISEGKWDHNMLANEFEEAILEECGFSEAKLTDVNEEPKEEKEKEKKIKTVACPDCGKFFDVEF